MDNHGNEISKLYRANKTTNDHSFTVYLYWGPWAGVLIFEFGVNSNVLNASVGLHVCLIYLHSRSFAFHITQCLVKIASITIQIQYQSQKSIVPCEHALFPLIKANYSSNYLLVNSSKHFGTLSIIYSNELETNNALFGSLKMNIYSHKLLVHEALETKTNNKNECLFLVLYWICRNQQLMQNRWKQFAIFCRNQKNNLNRGIVLRHDNVRYYTVRLTIDYFIKENEFLSRCSYLPDLSIFLGQQY